MKERMIIVNNQLIIGIAKKKNRTIISVYENGAKKVLSDIETGDYFWSKVVYNDYYIVAYSRGCMVNQIPLNIDGVYSIRGRKVLDLSNKKIKVLLEYMLLCRKGFDLTHVLTAINSSELGLVEESEKEYLINYLTSGNPKINHEQVFWYILSNYPQLRDYTNLTGPLSVVRYKEIASNLGTETYYFHTMPQEVHVLPNLWEYADNKDATDYMQIYISESEFSEKK